MPIRFYAACLLVFLLTPVGTRAQDLAFRVAPYLQFSTKTSMAILWETEEPATTRVEYGESRLGDKAPNLSMHVDLPGTRAMHEVVLEGLKPETKYFWRVVSQMGDGRELASEPSTFRTAVNDSSAYAFVLFGDTQDNPEVWGRIAQLGWQERPNFGLIAGDLVQRGGDIQNWLEEFFAPANTLMRRVPLYPAIGNHEDDHPNYYKYIYAPPPEYYYTFRYGNAQFFMVDTNRDVSEGSEQYEWLERELAMSDAMWKIVVHHHPPYSSEENDHGDTATGSSTYGTHARNLVPLYELYGVDFCLFGHVHMYERTWPILDGRVNQKNGVIYINSGGGGGGLEDFAPTRSWFSAKVKSVHHFGYFVVHDKTIFFQAIDEEGRLFDSFQLEKSPERLARVMMPPPPRFEGSDAIFLDETRVALAGAFEDLTIRYTTDGSEPSTQSARYAGPIALRASTTLKAAAFTADGVRSRVVSRSIEKVDLMEPVRPAKTHAGLAYAYYEGAWETLPDFSPLTPAAAGEVATFSIDGLSQGKREYALVFEGLIEAPRDGVYTFATTSDDGSKLYIHGREVVDNDGWHGERTREGQVALQAGLHPIRVEYFNRSGGGMLKVEWSGPWVFSEPIPKTAVFR
ncbi:MAG: PA14 domain-containing protein [Rhodothermales bacterium]